jgi:predicted enzyme related to lactoylglutathione lyase/catechol 2,3-dioxygenase-like lactoylglutathione lyase family enzyme
MKLGKSTILTLAVTDIGTSIAFYEKMGFSTLARNPGGAIMADGQIRLSLQQGDFPSPAITYFTPEVSSVVHELKQAGIEPFHQEEESGTVMEAGLIDPNGQPVMVVQLEADPLVPPMQKAKCGIFGEFSIPTRDIHSSLAFWEKLGYNRIGGDDVKPYPWAIASDDLFIIGFHQNPEFTSPSLTYFARDMAERIKLVKDAGVEFISESRNDQDQVIQAFAKSPDGQLISMFFAEGFEDGTNV